MPASRTVIVGGGVGGLCVAIRLAARGHDVTLCERLPEVGGKLAVYRRDGFTFDLGPSLLTLPQQFDEVMRCAGTSLDAELDVRRLSTQFRCFWQNHTTATFYDNPIDTASSLDGMHPGAGEEYLRFLKHSRTIWDVSERTFLAGPMSGPLSLLRRMKGLRDFSAIDARRTLSTAARKHFTHENLQQWLGRYATYSGSSPYRSPATLSCIASVEADHGAWYPIGGLGALRDALERVAHRSGVQIRTSCDVKRIVSRRGRVVGVEITGGETLDADTVVANVDAQHLYRDLVDEPKHLRALDKAGKSTSGVVVLVGARGTTPNIAHHNVWFSADYEREFTQIANGELPSDPTIYACVSSITDPSQAPAGHENWFLLVNAPAGTSLDGEYSNYGNDIVNRLAQVGPDLRNRALFIETIGPMDLEKRYRAPGGAIYGTSSNGRNAAFRRPNNRGPLKGLYLVGGSSHPGGGLPMVAVSARIVDDVIDQDLNGTRHR